MFQIHKSATTIYAFIHSYEQNTLCYSKAFKNWKDRTSLVKKSFSSNSSREDRFLFCFWDNKCTITYQLQLKYFILHFDYSKLGSSIWIDSLDYILPVNT